MTSEQLMEAFQHLDDDIIEAVDLIRRNPAPIKKTWSKWLATAACVCLVLTGIYAASGPFGASDGAVSEDMAIEENNAADQMDSESEILSLTLPDYNFSENVSQIQFYNFSESKQESTSDRKNDDSIYDGLVCTADILPIYSQMELASSILIMEDLAGFEQKLADITSYEIYDQYPSIDADEAAKLLKEGRYLTFTENRSNPSEIYVVEMVYLYDVSSDLAIPFYHFSGETTDDEGSIITGWFVPAISQNYITNMPDNSIKE